MHGAGLRALLHTEDPTLGDEVLLGRLPRVYRMFCLATTNDDASADADPAATELMQAALCRTFLPVGDALHLARLWRLLGVFLASLTTPAFALAASALAASAHAASALAASAPAAPSAGVASAHAASALPAASHAASAHAASAHAASAHAASTLDTALASAATDLQSLMCGQDRSAGSDVPLGRLRWMCRMLCFATTADAASISSSISAISAKLPTVQTALCCSDVPAGENVHLVRLRRLPGVRSSRAVAASRVADGGRWFHVRRLLPG